MAPVQLGRVQLLIMQVLWDKGRATAPTSPTRSTSRNRSPTAPSKRCSASSKKKAPPRHEADGRTFVFFPLVKEDKFKDTATRSLVERVFGGSGRRRRPSVEKRESLPRRDRRNSQAYRPQGQKIKRRFHANHFSRMARCRTHRPRRLRRELAASIDDPHSRGHDRCAAAGRTTGSAVQSLIYRSTLAAALSFALRHVGPCSRWFFRLVIRRAGSMEHGKVGGACARAARR